MDAMEAVEVIRNTSLFAGFRDEELEVVPKVALTRNYQAGVKIVEAGSVGAASLWLILEGEVEVQMDGEPICTLGPGEHFGEMALLSDDTPRSADVVAKSATTALEFRRSHLLGLVTSTPEIAVGMLAELAKRLRATNEVLRRVIAASPDAAKTALDLGLERSEPLADLGAIDHGVTRSDEG